ncbi:putative amino acid permease [Nocardia nova SH22a]|uniref:Putative amino acid permease n=1 Tax=Nocardia nova SH22a TaxID=1415166 RepID=W5TL62_9NOCA|nr:APC family permease [Nocardia nova]AHH20007.1 putative amino acid permease [Nocardia nova SH22a]
MTTTESRSAKLTASRIVFLVVAAAAPIAAMVGLAPLQYAMGNGAGTPATYVIAGAVLLCFGVGYAAMSRHITNTGGFYTFITRGLSRIAGVPSALVAVIAYSAVGLQLAGGFGYFVSNAIEQFTGISTPWFLWTVAGALAAGVLSYRSVDLSAKVLGVLMALEIGVLMIIDVVIVGHKGVHALPEASFHPHVVFGAGFSVSILIAFSTFIGFESAALYGEESRTPARTVPRAVYASLLVIMVFYTLTSWIGVGAAGADNIGSIAGQELGNYFPGLAVQYIGNWFSDAMTVLICTSLFASLLAILNASSRYLYSLGREQVLPQPLGRLHPRFGSPARAAVVVTAINVVVPALFYAARQDPYLTLVASMTGLGAVGIIALQATAAAAVIGYFLWHPAGHWWKTFAAPAIGLLGLITAEVLVVKNFSLLTGTHSAVINNLPWLYVIGIVAGLAYAWWLRSNRPGVYTALASDDHVRSDAGPIDLDTDEVSGTPEVAPQPEG